MNQFEQGLLCIDVASQQPTINIFLLKRDKNTNKKNRKNYIENLFLIKIFE